MLRLKHFISLTLLAVLTTSCSDEEAALDGGPGIDVPNVVDPGDIGEEDGAFPWCHRHLVRIPVELALVFDSDGDGLPDVLEDLNLDCNLDAGETDPNNPDTDGDGLLDGDEDADRNGRWDFDRGELNPRAVDTDGNGIPDNEEPKAVVCNHRHAAATFGERLILNRNTTMYVHPALKTVIPFGNTGAVYLANDEQHFEGLLFSLPATGRSFDETLHSVVRDVRRAARSAHVELAGHRTSQEYDQYVAHFTVEASNFDATTLVRLLSTSVTALEAPPRRALPTNVNVSHDGIFTFQLLGMRVGEDMRWALSWTSDERDLRGLSVVHPRLIAETPTDVVRFFCDDVDPVARLPLEILVVIEDGETTATVVEEWRAGLNATITLRRDHGLSTNVHILSKGLDDAGDERPEWVSYYDVGALTEDALQQAFMPSTGRLDDWLLRMLDSSPYQRYHENDVAVFALISESSLSEQDPTHSVPPGVDTSVWKNRSMVVVAPAASNFECGRRMSDRRHAELRTFVEATEAYVLASCGTAPSASAADRILAPIAGASWTGLARDPIWGTVALANGTTSVPAAMTVLAGQRAVVAPGAAYGERSAVSYAGWYSTTRDR